MVAEARSGLVAEVADTEAVDEVATAAEAMAAEPTATGRGDLLR